MALIPRLNLHYQLSLTKSGKCAQEFIMVNAMPLTSMIVYCPRSSLAGFTRFQSSRKWGKSSLSSEAETAEWMTKSIRVQKKLDVNILKVYRETANVVKKIYEKVWMETGKTRTMCGRVSEKCAFLFFPLKDNVKKGGDEDSRAVIRRRREERISKAHPTYLQLSQRRRLKSWATLKVMLRCGSMSFWKKIEL